MNRVQFIISTLVFVIGALLGFSVGEATIMTTVSNHSVQIAAETEARRSGDNLILATMQDNSIHYDKALTELAELSRTTIQQNVIVIQQSKDLMDELRSQRRAN
jgi:hypothetical protein